MPGLTRHFQASGERHHPAESAKLEEAFDELLHRAGSPLSTPVLHVAIEREYEDPLADLHIDIGKQRKGFSACDFGNLLAELVAALRNQGLPQSLHHVDTFCCFRQLSFGWCEHPLKPDHNEIPDNERAYIVWASPHELLLKLDDGTPNGIFHEMSCPRWWKVLGFGVRLDSLLDYRCASQLVQAQT